MSAPVLPLPREDGYWRRDAGQLVFVPFERLPSAKILSLPAWWRRDRLRRKRRLILEQSK